MRNRIALVAGSLLAAGLYAGGASAATIAVNPALAQIVEGAKKEGKLLIRSTPASTLAGPEAQAAAQAGIKAMFGVDIPIEWSPGAAYGPLVAQSFQEMQAGTPASTDVLALTPVQITPYLEKNLFRVVDWHRLAPATIPAENAEGGGKALRVSLSIPNILYNVKLAPWVNDIKNSADLLKPAYKGKFVTTPFLGGFDVLLAPEVWGVPKTTDYVKQFVTQISGFASCGSVDRVASGEIAAVVLDCAGGWPNSIQFRGKNVIGAHIVSDIAEKRYSYVSIPTHAAHPDAAILYCIYLTTPEGQEKVMAQFNGFDLGNYPGSYAKSVVDGEEAKGVKFIDVTVDWWQSHNLDQQVVDLTKLVTH